MPGAGLYEVGPGKTYSTIQSALDQLWTDQGAAIFTASQYIRVYAGIYDETVLPNTGLVPDAVNGFLLVVEGDPADDRANIKLHPGSGYGFNVGCKQIRVRHMWIDTVGTAYCVYSTTACHTAEVLDCKLTAVISTAAIRCAFGARVEDCEITLSGNGKAIFSAYAGFIVKSCKITGPGKASSTFPGITGDTYFTPSPTTVEGTVISGFEYGIQITDSRGTKLTVLNTTFHDCTVGIRSNKATVSPQKVVNCIFKDCTYNYQVIAWPEETSIRTGPAFIQRNNCYHGYTSFAYDGATTKSYAQWSAFNLVDNSGELDGIDPSLTNPSAKDFSLQAASPCRGTGYGSGLIAYVDGTAADGQHPNIGAAGTVNDPPAPIWGSGISNIIATDAVQNDRVSVTFDAAPIGGTALTVEYGVQYRIGVSAWVMGWIGEDLSVSIADLVQEQEYEFRVGARCAGYEQDWVYPSDSDTATPTGASEPAKPTITKIVDDETGTSITLTLVADNPADVLTVRYRALDVEAWIVFSPTRTGSGELQVTGLNPSKWTFIATAARIEDNSLPSDPAIEWATTGAPATGDVRSMPLLRRTPHVVILKRPAVSRDADNNVATRDYDNPIRTAQVKCLFQSRGGEVSIGDEGNIVPFDAKLYTLDKNMEVNDRVEVNLSFYTGNFLVTAVVPKGCIRGGYSHNEVLLQKDGVR